MRVVDFILASSSTLLPITDRASSVAMAPSCTTAMASLFTYMISMRAAASRDMDCPDGAVTMGPLSMFLFFTIPKIVA